MIQCKFEFIISYRFNFLQVSHRFLIFQDRNFMKIVYFLENSAMDEITYSATIMLHK